MAEKKKIPWMWVLTLLLFLTVYYLWSTMSSYCYQEQEVCYKTECTFWGCGKVQVDLDSPQCEVKKRECINGNIKAMFS